MSVSDIMSVSPAGGTPTGPTRQHSRYNSSDPNQFPPEEKPTASPIKPPDASPNAVPKAITPPTTNGSSVIAKRLSTVDSSRKPSTHHIILPPKELLDIINQLSKMNNRESLYDSNKHEAAISLNRLFNHGGIPEITTRLNNNTQIITLAKIHAVMKSEFKEFFTNDISNDGVGTLNFSTSLENTDIWMIIYTAIFFIKENREFKTDDETKSFIKAMSKKGFVDLAKNTSIGFNPIDQWMNTLLILMLYQHDTLVDEFGKQLTINDITKINDLVISIFKEGLTNERKDTLHNLMNDLPNIGKMLQELVLMTQVAYHYMSETLPKNWMSQLSNDFFDYLQQSNDQIDSMHTDINLPGPLNYKTERLKNSGVKLMFTWATISACKRYAKQSLTDMYDLINNGKLTEIDDHAHKIIVFVNDMFGFFREFFEEEQSDHAVNLMLALLPLNNWNITHAFAVSYVHILHETKKLIEAIAKPDTPEQSDLWALIKQTRANWVIANNDYTNNSKRFNSKESYTNDSGYPTDYKTLLPILGACLLLVISAKPLYDTINA